MRNQNQESLAVNFVDLLHFLLDKSNIFFVIVALVYVVKKGALEWES